jgi:isoquinoline 1-oxidoreductase beta subunit
MSRLHLVNRRGFLSHLFSAGALVVGAPIVRAASKVADGAKASWMPSVYVGLSPDGMVKIVTHRSEMGTGCRSVLPMIVADELEADWSKVQIEQAIGDEKYGSQNTDGSCSVRDFYDILREAGASVRAMLEQSAAARWSVPVTEVKAANHFVVHTGSGRKLGYGELVESASKLSLPAKGSVRLKQASEFRYIGKDLPMIDREDLCMGQGTFGMDAKLPGMVYASIERPPVFGGKLKAFDDTEARKVKGVQQTVTLDGLTPPYLFKPLGGVAVIADNTWSAMQGRKKLKVDWDAGENAGFDSEGFRQQMLATAKNPCQVVRKKGDVEAGFRAAAKTHEAEYTTPILAHASMEPPVALAEYRDGRVIAYAPTQNPQAVQEAVAGAMGLKKEDVECHVTLLGGGFGRKSKPDYVVEAALLAKKVGKPVKVVWSREEDIRFDYYHAPSAMYFKAGTDAKGMPVSWLQRSVYPPIMNMFDGKSVYGSFENGPGMGWGDIPFQLPNLQVENGPAKPPVRIGWLRSVANIYHAFGVQGFLDELAAASGRDRVEYMLAALGSDRTIDFAGEQTELKGNPKFPFETARLRRVIDLVAEKSGWAKSKPSAGRALGFAAHWSFFTYVAAVAQVEVDKSGAVRIPRVDLAIDPGVVIHPDRVRSQFEGAATFAASIALMSEVTAANGAIRTSNFHNYQVARMHQAPVQTYVHIVNSTAPPAGVGEPGVPPVIPAITNGIFAATGKRIRHLPVKSQLKA